MVKPRGPHPIKQNPNPSKTATLTASALLILNQKERLRNERIARGNSNPNDAIDTPGEVELIMNVGNSGRPVDTPIEVDQFIKKNAGTIEKHLMGHKTKEDPDFIPPKITP